ncbi:MAG: hypothetical protein AAF423_13525 [Pseudomonadota bacterium]
MNNDRISNTPGGERMLVGALVFLFGLLFYQAYQYRIGDIGQLIVIAVILFGAVQFGRGIFAWKYADRKAFAANKLRENLFVDVPIKNKELSVLYAIEDALIELIKSSKTVQIEMQSVDTANNMGTIHLSGQQADAMFAQTYLTLARFALPNGLHLFPRPGRPIDPEIQGKRLLLDLPATEVVL